MNKFLLFIIYLLFTIITVTRGQKYINDSVVVHIDQNPAVQNKRFQIYNIIDNREQQNNILDITEKKKYLVVPVDYYYLTEKPLGILLDSLLGTDTAFSDMNKFQLEIDYFQPGIRKGGFLPQYYLNACVTAVNVTNRDHWLESGKLVFETTISYKSAHKNTKEAYEKLVYLWQEELIKDINNLQAAPPAARTIIVPNYKPPGFVYKKNLITRLGFIYGLNWYGMEGEMFFSPPENGKSFARNTGTVRYVNQDNYETIFLGRDNENFFWRQGPASLFELQSKFLIGLNKWKDVNTVQHGIWEIFQPSLSLSQMYHYNRIDKKGLIFSLGLVEDVFYIYNNVGFRVGLKLTIGLKL